MEEPNNEEKYERALDSTEYIDYCAKDINALASILFSQFEEDGAGTREELLEAKTYFNTIIAVLLTERDWCDDTLKEIKDFERDKLEEEVWNSLS